MLECLHKKYENKKDPPEHDQMLRNLHKKYENKEGTPEHD